MQTRSKETDMVAMRRQLADMNCTKALITKRRQALQEQAHLLHDERTRANKCAPHATYCFDYGSKHACQRA